MKRFAAIDRLLDPTALAVARDDRMLDLYIGRDWYETHRDIGLQILSDGLSREAMRVLVKDRAQVLLGLESLAECTSEIVAPVTPLARSLADVDFAIVTVSDWLVKLAENESFQRIVDLKRHAREVGLDEGPADASDEAIEAWSELFDAYCEDAAEGQICFEMGDRDVIITIEAQCTVLMVETEAGTDDLEILVVFQHSLDDDDDRGGGDDDPGPRPDPVNPRLIDA